MTGIKMKRWIAAMVSVVMLYGLLAGAFAPQADAATARIAKIVSVTGDVQITKSGGTKPYKAFSGLYLNQGDHIKTGKNSSLVLEVEDRKDEVTVGANAELYVSQLKEDDGSKNTSLKVWSGSVWTKASSLVDTKDTFEVETPTAVMGVRGTQFSVNVDPKTGRMSVTVNAGIVQVHPSIPSPGSSRNADGNAPIVPSNPITSVFPGMQADVYENPLSGDISHVLSYLDLDDLAGLADPAIIEAMIRNKNVADQENEKLLEKFKQDLDNHTPPGLDLDEQEQLDNYREMLDHLTGNILKTAIEKGTVDEQTIEDIVNKTQQQIGSEFELDYKNPPAPKLTSQQQAMKERALEEKRRQQQQLQQKEQMKEQQRQNQQNLLNQIMQEQQRQQEQNEQKAEQKQQNALDKYLNSLTEQERERLLKEIEARENAQNQQPTSPSGGGGSSSPGRPSPPANTGTELNGTGIYTGSVTARVNSGNATYGPVSGMRTIDGNVTITGNTSGDIALRNLMIAGDLIVDATNASVLLQETVVVEGETIIRDVSSRTLTSQATHGGKLEVQDSNGAGLHLSGAASEALVDITGDGEVALRGEFLHLVKVTGAAMLKIDADARISQLEILSSDAQLENEGWIGDILYPSDLEVHGSVLLEVEKIIQRKIAAVNAADSLDSMREALHALGLGHEMSEAAIEYMLAHRPETGFSTYEQILKAVQQAIDHEVPGTEPYVAYFGSSPIMDPSAIKVEVAGADVLYALDMHALVASSTPNLNPDVSLLEKMVTDGIAKKFNVPSGQTSMNLNLSPLTSYYQVNLIIFAARGDQVSKPTRSIAVPGEDVYFGNINGSVTLTEPAPAGGVRVMVFARYSYEYEWSLRQPIMDEAADVSLENYTFVDIAEGETAASYNLRVNRYGSSYVVGYSIVSELPEDSLLLKQGYAGHDDTMVSYAHAEQARFIHFPHQTEDEPVEQVSLTVASGVAVTGTVQVHANKLGGSDTVYVLAENEQGQAGFASVAVTGTAPVPFKVIAPEGSSYRMLYFLSNEYVLDNAYYYGEAGAYTRNLQQAAWVDSADSVNLVLPDDEISIAPLEFSETGFGFTFTPIEGADQYQFKLYDEYGTRFWLTPESVTAEEAAASQFTIYIDELMSEREEGLMPNRTYYLSVAAYADEGSGLVAAGVGRMYSGVLYSKPYVLSSAPFENSQAVPTDAIFTLTYNEPVTVSQIDNGFVLLSSDGIPTVGVSAEVQGDGTKVIVSFDQELVADSYYILQANPRAVRNSHGVSSGLFELAFHTAITNVQVPSVTSTVYEDSLHVSWVADGSMAVTRYDVWVNNEWKGTTEGTSFDLAGQFAATDLAILVRAYDGQTVVAETELFPAFNPVRYFNAQAGFYDGIILFFEFEEVAGAASYVIYNDLYGSGQMNRTVKSEPGQVQVNTPGRVIIIAVDETGRVMAKSEIQYTIDYQSI
ncbi:hypothetical protein DUZ99_08270 [Xylanibacillus composti]|uniref:FecR domain-containing protein n=1 Tax=Xylanibacillus composti TaxID=1572762 RepID=A0A8J4H3X9_9BACL|nr:FecR domain-containing protein [Xylanibacillus composti]MDT9724988.1 hypothetical protein [Xylanibacillus composti]GIQ68228.1 FecR domain-containing protein [Xylanibacillus composti]